MLEYARLHVDGWARAEQSWVRRIQDDASNPIGFVRFQGQVRDSWLGWLRSVRLEVFETEDASHLMSVVRTWGLVNLWTVFDADGRRVGTVSTGRLLDTQGEQRAQLVQDSDQQGKIVDPDQRLLAYYAKKTRADLEVAFTAEPTANPFLRMLVLSSILLLESAPPRRQ